MSNGAPDKLGKYPIEAILGKGAMGVVYKAFDPVIKRPVAIKTIRKELIEDDVKAGSMAARFRHEAQAAGGLAHPGIVAVYEYGEDADYAYIAMEYVEGNSLREYFARGTQFELRDVVSIMAQLLDALEYAHARSVWHRDIKPANIIIMSNGRLKLADFGIARVDTSELTQAGAIMGTPGYIAPEQYFGHPIDQRIDIFAAGVVMYQLVAGRSPFSGSGEAIIYGVCHVDPPPCSHEDTLHRWPRYDAVVARALSKAPDDRYPSAEAFREAILAIYAQPVAQTLSEETIITDIVRPAAAIESSAPPGASSGSPGVAAGGATPAPSGGSPAAQSSGSTPSHPGGSTPPPTNWDATVLARVEGQLARFVGPVARVLVRRAAREHDTLHGLIGKLAEFIAEERDRQAFLAKAGGGTTPAHTHPGAGTQVHGGGPAIAADEIERATRLLSAYIGPIARIVVKRAAAEGGGTEALYLRLAESLEVERDRQRFLRDVGLDKPRRG